MKLKGIKNLLSRIIKKTRQQKTYKYLSDNGRDESLRDWDKVVEIEKQEGEG